MTTLGALLQRFERGADARMTVVAPDEELRRIEGALGVPLPGPLRALLGEVGSGLYEGGHEIFGPLRLMLHDIELVPDMLSVRARLAGEGVLDPHLMPFHRGGATYHLIRVEGAGTGSVVSLPPGHVYADLESFIEEVLLRGQREALARPTEPCPSPSGGNDMLKTIVVTLTAAAVVLGAAGSASATIAMQKKAREAGLEAQ